MVEADLRGMTEDEDGFAMEFSRKHAEAWLNALNQVRLALAAVHGFKEKDMDRHGEGDSLDERDVALVQIHFYGLIQSWLLEILEGSE
jgi:hypothetical protein